MWTVPAIVAVIGGIALLAGLFGGFEAQQLKVAPLPRELRVLSGIIGLIFLGIAIRLSSPDHPAPTPVNPTAVFVPTSPTSSQLSPTTLPTSTAGPIRTMSSPALPTSDTTQAPTPTAPIPAASTSTPPQVAAPLGTTLLQSSLDSADAITSPAVGLGGRTTFAASDFAPGHTGNGAQFTREGENCGSPAYQAITFPVSRGDGRNIAFDRGELEFWYKPDYDASDFNDRRTLITVSIDGYNPPFMILDQVGQLTLLVDDGHGGRAATATIYGAALWKAGQWTHIRITWDSTQPTDSLQIFVNGRRVDQDGAGSGWNFGSDTEHLKIMVGSRTPCGDVIADGAIDELIIRH